MGSVRERERGREREREREGGREGEGERERRKERGLDDLDLHSRSNVKVRFVLTGKACSLCSLARCLSVGLSESM